MEHPIYVRIVVVRDRNSYGEYVDTVWYDAEKADRRKATVLERSEVATVRVISHPIADADSHGEPSETGTQPAAE